MHCGKSVFPEFATAGPTTCRTDHDKRQFFAFTARLLTSSFAMTVADLLIKQAMAICRALTWFP